jgi:hypothetical protein
MLRNSCGVNGKPKVAKYSIPWIRELIILTANATTRILDAVINFLSTCSVIGALDELSMVFIIN